MIVQDTYLEEVKVIMPKKIYKMIEVTFLSHINQKILRRTIYQPIFYRKIK